MGKRQIAKVFGKAEDFYRVRVITLEVNALSDFEWREDILFDPPLPEPEGKIVVKHRLEVVNLDTGKSYALNYYKTRIKAQKVKNRIDEDVKELTKMEFERKYLTGR